MPRGLWHVASDKQDPASQSEMHHICAQCLAETESCVFVHVFLGGRGGVLCVQEWSK